MKYLKDLVWLTQLGLSVITPLLLFLLGAVWLRDRFGLGVWVLFLGIAFGLYSSYSSARAFARYWKSRQPKEKGDPPVNFREHD